MSDFIDRRGGIFLAAGGAILALGLGTTLLMAFSGGYPTFAPLLVAAVGVPPLVLGILARRSTAPGAILRRESWISLGFVATVFAGGWLFTGVEREERFEMVWSRDVDDAGRPHPSRILLEFVDHPGWVSKMNSRDLADYLESRGSDRVPVVYRVTRDLGSARGFIEVQVGDRRSWREDGEGGFSRRGTERSKAAGGIGPSPFR